MPSRPDVAQNGPGGSGTATDAAAEFALAVRLGAGLEDPFQQGLDINVRLPALHGHDHDDTWRPGESRRAGMGDDQALNVAE
jgi:hypothetical protein